MTDATAPQHGPTQGPTEGPTGLNLAGATPSDTLTMFHDDGLTDAHPGTARNYMAALRRLFDLLGNVACGALTHGAVHAAYSTLCRTYSPSYLGQVRAAFNRWADWIHEVDQMVPQLTIDKGVPAKPAKPVTLRVTAAPPVAPPKEVLALQHALGVLTNLCHRQRTKYTVLNTASWADVQANDDKLVTLSVEVKPGRWVQLPMAREDERAALRVLYAWACGDRGVPVGPLVPALPGGSAPMKNTALYEHARRGREALAQERAESPEWQSRMQEVSALLSEETPVQAMVSEADVRRVVKREVFTTFLHEWGPKAEEPAPEWLEARAAADAEVESRVAAAVGAEAPG